MGVFCLQFLDEATSIQICTIWMYIEGQALRKKHLSCKNMSVLIQ